LKRKKRDQTDSETHKKKKRKGIVKNKRKIKINKIK
jgi:hypothetical protein